MALSISSLTTQATAAAVNAAQPVKTGKPGEFASLLAGAVERVDQYRTQATQAVDNLITGETGELHSVALAAQRAELAFELGLQVRNKVVQAYQEIMRMQL
jgi:flagellar hook-basal body complex protein FliE